MLGCLRERCKDLAGQWKYIVCAPDWPNSNTVLKTRESKRGGSAQGLHPAAFELGADLGDELRRVVEVGGSVAEEGDASADEVVLPAVVGSQVVARGVPSTRVSRGGGLQGGVPPQRWGVPSTRVSRGGGLQGGVPPSEMGAAVVFDAQPGGAKEEVQPAQKPAQLIVDLRCKSAQMPHLADFLPAGRDRRWCR